MAAYRFGLFDVVIAGAAVLTVIVLAAGLQRAGLTQPLALAIAVPCSLLVLYPAMRRWSRAEVPFHKWVITVLLIALAGLVLDIVVGKL